MLGDTTTQATTPRLATTGADILRWFFDQVLPRWDAVAAGTADDADTDLLTGCCVLPMLVTSGRGTRRARDREEVRRFVEAQILVLRLADNHHILVPDCRVTAYTPASGSLDVIWSHRRADGTEIIRYAVHYDVARLDDGWRITGVHVVPTEEPTLDRIWTPTPAHEIG